MPLVGLLFADGILAAVNISDWQPLAFAIGLATVEMGCAFIIGRGIKRAANPFGSVWTLAAFALALPALAFL
jgi:hypothetical protein